MKKIIVLTPTRYKDKEVVKHFKSGGFDVYKDRPMTPQIKKEKMDKLKREFWKKFVGFWETANTPVINPFNKVGSLRSSEDVWEWIAKALLQAKREGREEAVEEIEGNIVNLKGYKMFSFKGVMKLLRDYRKVALTSKSGGKK